MMILEIVALTVLGCSAFYVPFFLYTLKRERKLLREKELMVEAKNALIVEERRQFFNALREKAAANAMTPCRTCVSCRRVVHRYRPLADGVICHECDVEAKKIR